MADLTAFRAAIALKSAVVGVEVSTSSNSGGVADSPMVLVNTVNGFNTLEQGRGMGWERVTYDIPSDLLVAKPGDIEDALEVALTIVELLRVAARSDIDLGFPGVVEDSWLDSAEIGELEYAGQQWLGAKLLWKVMVFETVTRAV